MAKIEGADAARESIAKKSGPKRRNLIRRLRTLDNMEQSFDGLRALGNEAADEIERLAAITAGERTK